MDPMLSSALVSAGGNLLGSLFGGKGQSSAQASRLAVEAEQRALSNQHILATHMPGWLREGAKNAGYHPLSVLGMNPSMGSTSIVSDGGGRNNVFDGLAAAGQDVARAIGAIQTKEQRDQQRAMEALSVERAQLENEHLRSQIATQRAQLPPAMAEGSLPIPGQGDSAGIFTTYLDDQGRPVRGYTEQGAAAMEPMMATNAWYDVSRSLPDAIRNDSKGLAKFYRAWRDRSRMNSPYRKGLRTPPDEFIEWR